MNLNRIAEMLSVLTKTRKTPQREETKTTIVKICGFYFLKLKVMSTKYKAKQMKMLIL